MTKPEGTTKHPVTIWQIAMLFLCVYVLGALFVNTVFRLPSETSALLNRIDTFVCLVFIGDFVFNVIAAKSKLGYLKWGWIDLISSIPNIHILRWGRFARIIRILRILRGIRSTKLILKFFFANRAKGTFASVAMISFVLVVFSSIAILNCETSPESNIKTASDALWWSFVTITTVGYGDFYPTTLLGRIIAAVLMTAGVGLFGTFTAYVASFFFQQEEEEEEKREEEILSELKAIRQRLDRLEGNTEQSSRHVPK
ncbi:potassium channel family protein [bacterium]|nr:potassium channel family protein [bacterium]